MMTRKKRQKCVEQILGEALCPKGFAFSSMARREHYEYTRKVGDVLQGIEIMVYEMGRVIDVRYYTLVHFDRYLLYTLLQQKGIDPNSFGYEADIMGWHYTDDESYKGLLQLLRELIEKYVLDELERLSVYEKEVRITAKNFYDLREHSEEMIARCRAEWKLEEYNFDEQITILSSKITELKGKTFQEAEKPLSEIGLAYGDCIERQFGGEWFWVDDWYTIGVHDVANRLITVHVIVKVFEEWQGQDALLNEIEKIRHKIETTEERPTYPKRPEWTRRLNERLLDRI